MATTSIGASGVTFPDSTTQASAGATGVLAINVYTSSSTWTKPATVKSIKVTVVGGGGNGGAGSSNPVITPGLTQTRSGGIGGGGGGGGCSIRDYPAASLPGPQPFTVGGAGSTSSFGGTATVISATGGSAGGSSNTNGVSSGGAGGSGSGGDLNITGQTGEKSTIAFIRTGAGGSSTFGFGGVGNMASPSASPQAGNPGYAYGGGGSGGYVATVPSASPITQPGGAGTQGIVIIEEFY